MECDICSIYTLGSVYRLLNCFLSVVVISFSPQNYTVPEGTPADIMIVLDKPSPKDITITVTTMDITAQGTVPALDIVLSDKL